MACRPAFILLMLAATLGTAPDGTAQDVPRFPTLPLDTRRPSPPVTVYQLPLPPPSLPPVSNLFDNTLPPTAAPPRPAPANEETFLPDGSRINLPANAKKQLIRFSPRYGVRNKFDFEKLPDGTQRVVYTAGLIVNVVYDIETRQGLAQQEYEFAADNMVIWLKNLKDEEIGGEFPINPGEDSKLEVEIYMTGNVVIRSKDEQASGIGRGKTVVTRTLRAEQIYYDVNRNRAVALQADLELAYDNVKESVHLSADRMERLGRSEWRAKRGRAYSSKLPSDPALEFLSSEATFTERETVLRNIFGLPYRRLPTGEVEYGYERILTGRNARIELLGIPTFYTPYLRTDPAEPFGPLQGIAFGSDAVFGVQFYTTWDLYKLFALRAPQGHSWKLNLDYLGDRGPGYGTDYNYTNPNFFGFGGPNRGAVTLYGINDGGVDNLGEPRGQEPLQSLFRDGERIFRGRANWRNQQEILADRDRDGLLTAGPFVTLQNQFAHVSDKNFLEQYFKQEFDNGPNQETFGYLSGSTGRLSGSLLVQGGQDRNWITETRWLPRATGALLGQSFFDLFTYHSRADVGYAEFRPSEVYPPPVFDTEKQRLETGRIDWWQELSLPLNAGPVRVVPYGIVDLTGYTNDLNGDSRGRVYGGGGARAAISFSRLYPNASNELFNLKGLNHKATWHGNYYYARSSEGYTEFPQLDRLDDDTIDFSRRTTTPFQDRLVGGRSGDALMSAGFFDPQRYAIRRLVENRIDTRDDIQVVQLGLDQRLQTKRGFPGREHTIDWLTLDLSTSLFPQPDKDNFGKSAAFLEYSTIWNVGDQTALVANGWFDPFTSGARYWNVGAYLSRPDGTSFYLGYRETDPVNSKAVTLNIGYQLTRKYGVSVQSSYDFGTQRAQTNTFLVSRTGTDLTFTVGFTYNQLTNNTGVSFTVIPNIAAAAGIRRFGSPQFGGQ